MDEVNPEEQVESTRDKGGALEKNVEFVFQSAGFETQRNVKLAKYEIDVLAKIGDRNIVIECKNYQNSNLVIRNLIHQWNSKNQIIKANKIIIVLAGISIKQSDRELAGKFYIELWNESDITDLFNLSLKPNELREKLLSKISLKPVSIAELYRDEIAGLVIRPLLTGMPEDLESNFNLFNSWLRAFIRTNLQIEGTNKEDRIKHIELFEGTKEKGAFFNLFKIKRTEIEYWDKLAYRLQKDKILDKKVQLKYYGIMQTLHNEFKAQKEYYQEEDKEKQVRKLIRDRLYHSLISDKSVCNFGFIPDKTVEVIPANEGRFIVRLSGINEKQANLVNWILTSEYNLTKQTDTDLRGIHYWLCFSLDESSEKIYRILEEFYGYTKKDNLRDFAL